MAINPAKIAGLQGMKASWRDKLRQTMHDSQSCLLYPSVLQLLPLETGLPRDHNYP